MTIQVMEVDEEGREYWDKAVARFTAAHPLNAYGWGKVRKIDGWKPIYFIAKEGETVKGMAMVLFKKIPVLGLSLMYAPKGPLWDPADCRTLEVLLARLREEGKRRKAVFLRIDPNIPETRFQEESDPFVEQGFVHLSHRWSFWNSPRDVYRIDLTKAANLEELFNIIDRDARRCVRKAEKEGVAIRPAEKKEELQRFYQIFSEFSVGKGFMCRQYKYQEALWREFIERGNGRLFLAIYKEEIIGGLICLLFGKKCLAMHMGTPYRYQKLQTYYAYVWESIKWAKQNGCRWYSFRGVGTTPTQERFKRKFRPEVVSLSGYYDLPYRPWAYRVFYACEFEWLPRAWRTLMRLRRGQKWLVEQIKGRRIFPIPG